MHKDDKNCCHTLENSILLHHTEQQIHWHLLVVSPLNVENWIYCWTFCSSFGNKIENHIWNLENQTKFNVFRILKIKYNLTDTHVFP